MAKSVPGTPTNKSSVTKNFNLPPRRGRIKEEIFGGLARSIASAAAKVGRVFGRNVGDGGSSSSTSASSSASASEQDNETS